MNCRDFQATWNARLDARDVTPLAGGPLETHAAACPSCRVLGTRYQTLQQAMQRLAAPVPPSEFVAGTLSAAESGSFSLSEGNFWIERGRRYAAAAALVAALGIGAWSYWVQTPAPAPLIVQTLPTPEPDDLTTALAMATSATLDLAREASAPAGASGGRSSSAAELPASPTAPELSANVPGMGLAEVWQSVGDRVNDGVRPLGGSARHAFGFLLGTPVDDPAPPAPVPAPKQGARAPGDRGMERTLRRVATPLVGFVWAALFCAPSWSLGADARPADPLLRLAPADAGVTVVVEDLRGRVKEFLASPLASKLAALPAVKAWQDSETGRNFRRAQARIATILEAEFHDVRDGLLGEAFLLALRLPPDGRPEDARGLLLTRVPDRALLDLRAGRLERRSNEKRRACSCLRA